MGVVLLLEDPGFSGALLLVAQPQVDFPHDESSLSRAVPRVEGIFATKTFLKCASKAFCKSSKVRTAFLPPAAWVKTRCKMVRPICTSALETKLFQACAGFHARCCCCSCCNRANSRGGNISGGLGANKASSLLSLAKKGTAVLEYKVVVVMTLRELVREDEAKPCTTKGGAKRQATRTKRKEEEEVDMMVE